MTKPNSRKTTAKSTKKPTKTQAPLKSTKKSAKSKPLIKLVSRPRDGKVPTQRTIDVKLFG